MTLRTRTQGGACACTHKRRKQTHLSIPKPSMLLSNTSPPKYLAYTRLRGSPRPNPARGGRECSAAKTHGSHRPDVSPPGNLPRTKAIHTNRRRQHHQKGNRRERENRGTWQPTNTTTDETTTCTQYNEEQEKRQPTEGDLPEATPAPSTRIDITTSWQKTDDITPTMHPTPPLPHLHHRPFPTCYPALTRSRGRATGVVPVAPRFLHEPAKQAKTFDSNSSRSSGGGKQPGGHTKGRRFRERGW